MNNRSAPAAARPVVRACAVVVATATLAAGFGPGAAAQAPSAPKAAPKAQPKSSPPPAAQPQQPAGSPNPQIVYVPWTKFCEKGQEANAKQVCFTVKYGRDESSGMTAVMALLVEPEGSARKLLRVTLPLGMQLAPGVRTVVDQGQPMEAPYTVCVINGCTVEYEASGELVGKLKTGRGLVVKGIDYQGNEITHTLPLSDFATSHDGPPTDAKLLAEQEQKLQDLLQKRAEEARKKLEGQQQPAKK